MRLLRKAHLKAWGVCASLAILLVSVPVYAERRITIGYQGVVESHGDILDNTTVSMKFVLCDEGCNTVYWSNDGTSAGGSEPQEAVAVPVVGGVFNVQLGDDTYDNMETIASTTFDKAGDQDLYLRVWLDDGIYGFEQLFPDQLVSVVPFSVRAVTSGEMVGSMTLAGDVRVTTTAAGDADGVVFNAKSVTDGSGVLVQVDALGDKGLAFQVEDTKQTLFSVNRNGSAYSRDILLQPVTSSSEIIRFETGRIFYDGKANVFKGCTNTACSEIALGLNDGIGDITRVTAGNGLTGGGTFGPVTLDVDTNVVVTKSGNHVMQGSLTTAGFVTSTLAATTTTTVDLTATGKTTTDSLQVNAGTTTKEITLNPNGTSTGNTSEIRFLELAANGTHYLGFKAPDSVILSKIWTLPTGDGSANQLLATDGSGNLVWKTDANAGGDITAVTAGLGLSGGATSGIATVNIDSATGIQINTDSVQFDYANFTLAADSASQGVRQTVFDGTDAQGGLLFEGATDNAFQTLLTVAEPTADRTLTLPDETGTVCTTGAVCTGYQASGTALTTATTWTGDLSGTGSSPTIGSNKVTGAMIAVGSDATGDILYYNGTDYTRLGIGTANQLLKTNSAANAPQWTAPDNTSLSDRTRSLYLPARLFGQSNGTAMSLAFVGTYPERYEEWPLVTAPVTAPQAIYASSQVPQDWASSTTLDFYVYYTQSGTDAATWRCEVNFASLANVESAVTASTTVGATITPDGSMTATQIDSCGSSSANVAGGEWLRINLERDSGHAGDTNGDTIQVLGLEIRYTADM